MTTSILKEADIQKEVCEYLEEKGQFFWRQNNTPVYDEKQKRYRAMSKFAMKGVPDIMIVTDGGFMVFLEIKGPSGRLSSEQKEFQAKCKEKGAEYYVIHSVHELIDLGL